MVYPKKKVSKTQEKKKEMKKPGPKSAPMARSAAIQPKVMRTRNMTRNTCVETGTDLVRSLSTTLATAGDILATIPLCPSQFGNRLRSIAMMYEKWRIRRMAIRFEGACASTQAGMVLGFVDYDPTEEMGSGSASLPRASAHLGAKSVKLWDRYSWDVKTLPRTEELYTHQSVTPRTSSMGNFFLIAATDLDATAPGMLYVDYEIEFYSPQYDVQQTGAGGRFNAVSGMTPAGPMGTDYEVMSWNSVHYPVSADSIGAIPPGHYSMQFEMVGTAVSGAPQLVITDRVTGLTVTADYKFEVFTSVSGSTDILWHCDNTSYVSFTISCGAVTGATLSISTLPAYLTALTKSRKVSRARGCLPSHSSVVSASALTEEKERTPPPTPVSTDCVWVKVQK